MKCVAASAPALALAALEARLYAWLCKLAAAHADADARRRSRGML